MYFEKTWYILFRNLDDMRLINANYVIIFKQNLFLILQIIQIFKSAPFLTMIMKTISIIWFIACIECEDIEQYYISGSFFLFPKITHLKYSYQNLSSTKLCFQFCVFPYSYLCMGYYNIFSHIMPKKLHVQRPDSYKFV